MPLEELRLAHDRRLVSIVLVMMLVPIFWFVGFGLVESVRQGLRLDLRLATQLLLLAVPVAGFILTRRVTSPGAFARIVFGVSLALGATMIALSLQRPAGSVMLMRTPLLYVIAMYAVMPSMFYAQLAAPLAYSLGVAALRVWWFADYRDGDRLSDLLVLLFVNLVGIAMVLRRWRLEREVDASWQREHAARAEAEQALKHLRTLQGIIKICSYCRKVHSETGVWQQIETYVRERTGVEFTHGICPTCLAEHYPESEPIKV